MIPSFKASLLVGLAGGLALGLSVNLLAQGGLSVEEAAALITPEDIHRRIAFLADDSMKGRAAPSAELEQAAQYVAAEFQHFGLKPGGEEKTYFQRFPLDRVQVLAVESFVRITDDATIELAYGRDCFYPYNDWPQGDYKGTLVVVSGPFNQPPTFDPASLAGKVILVLGKPGLPGRYDQVAAWRPAAVLIAEDLTESAIAKITSRQSGPSTLSPRPARFPAMEIREAAVAPILAKRGVDLSGLRQTKAEALSATFLNDIVVHVRIRTRVLEKGIVANVVAILEGSDSKLQHQHLVCSAHLDHLGVRQSAVDGDAIFNGADDNASGVAALLEVARAFARLSPKPRRSIIFLGVTAEEMLGWGAEYFVRHPPVAISNIVANINADMVGRNWTDRVIVHGRGDSDLGRVVDQVAAAHPELNMRPIDNPETKPNLYYWSDHEKFFSVGIPFLYFFSGMHSDYHQPSDSVDKIDAEKTSRIAKLMFYVGLEIVNAAERPTWNPDSYRKLVGGSAGRANRVGPE